MELIKTLKGMFSKKTASVAAPEQAKPEVINLAANGHAYDAGAPPTNWSEFYVGGTEDENILNERWQIVARFKDLDRCNALYNSIITGVTNQIVSTGPKFSCDIPGAKDKVNDLVESEFKIFSENLDAGGQYDLLDMTRLAVRGTLSLGDSFTVFSMSRKPKDVYKTKARIIDPDRVSTPSDIGDTEMVKEGILKNDYGDNVGVYINRDYEVSNGYGKNSKAKYFQKNFYDSDDSPQVTQLMFPKFAYQTRGLPLLTPAYKNIKDIGTFTASELTAAVVASNINVVKKVDNVNAEMKKAYGQSGIVLPKTPEAASNNIPSWGTGAKYMTLLAQNQELEQFKMERPTNAFVPFIEYHLKEICASVGHSYSFLFHDPQSLSFSGARADNQDNQLVIGQYQNALIRNFLNPIKYLFLAELIASEKVTGYTHAELMDACTFEFTPNRILDINKELLADELQLKLGATTIEKICKKYGNDYQAILEQAHRERGEYESMGLVYPGIGAPQVHPTNANGDLNPNPTQPGRIASDASTLS